MMKFRNVRTTSRPSRSTSPTTKSRRIVSGEGISSMLASKLHIRRNAKSPVCERVRQTQQKRSSRSLSPKRDKSSRTDHDNSINRSSRQHRMKNSRKSPVSFGNVVRVRQHERIINDDPNACYASLDIGWGYASRSLHLDLKEQLDEQIKPDRQKSKEEEEKKFRKGRGHNITTTSSGTLRKSLILHPHHHNHHNKDNEQALLKKAKDHERLQKLTKYGFTPREVLETERVKRTLRNENFFSSFTSSPEEEEEEVVPTEAV